MRPDVIEAFAAEVAIAINAALGPVLDRLAAAESTLGILREIPKDLAGLRERAAVLEARAPVPGPPPVNPLEAMTAALGPVLERVTVIEATAGQVRDLVKDVGQLRERAAVLETRAPVPGPPGADGANGTNGADGVGFDDLGVEFDGERTLAVTFTKGDQRRTFPIPLPFLKYQGVYQTGHTYAAGDVVTWAGHMWHCGDPTITKPGESKAWQQCVQRGRDGRA